MKSANTDHNQRILTTTHALEVSRTPHLSMRRLFYVTLIVDNLLAARTDRYNHDSSTKSEDDDGMEELDLANFSTSTVRFSRVRNAL